MVEKGLQTNFATRKGKLTSKEEKEKKHEKKPKKASKTRTSSTKQSENEQDSSDCGKPIAQKPRTEEDTDVDAMVGDLVSVVPKGSNHQETSEPSNPAANQKKKESKRKRESFSISSSDQENQPGKDYSTETPTPLVEKIDNPFLDNRLSTHCKFSSPYELQAIKTDFYTKILRPTTLENIDSLCDDPKVLSSTQRIKKMCSTISKGLTGPKLLTSQGYKCHDSINVHDCDIFIRPKVASGNQGDADVAMDTDGKGEELTKLFQFSRELGVLLEDVPTFDDYLECCSSDESFNTSDVEIATIVWQAAKDRNALGTTMSRLKVIFFMILFKITPS